MALQVVLIVAQVACIGQVHSVQVSMVLEVIVMQEAGWAVWARVGTFFFVLYVNLYLRAFPCLELVGQSPPLFCM